MGWLDRSPERTVATLRPRLHGGCVAIALLCASAILVQLVSAPPLGAAGTAGPAAPTVVSPGPGTDEVPGGWTGPVSVDFDGVTDGSYDIVVSCAGGYRNAFTHLVPDDGFLFSSSVAPMPANRGCGMSVAPSDDEGSWLAFAEFISTSRTFAIEDVEASRAFYPRRVDGYEDELRIDYWLTQPAHVSVSIVNEDSLEVALLVKNHRYSGGNRLVWDGRTDSGQVPPKGRYSARIVATNLSGEQRGARVGFYLADEVPFGPGRAGPARAGMTKQAAMATGAFRSNVRYTVPGVCTKVYSLLPKSPHEFTYSVFVQRGRIVEISAVMMPEVQLPRGLQTGATVRQVRRAYPNRPIAGEAGYANNALFFKAGRKWIAYVFDSYTYRRSLRPADKLKFVSVSVGRRPGGMQNDGC